MSRGIRYRLDSDDIVTDGFLIEANANAIIRGLSDNASVPLGVTAGGTGATTFQDGEFITYSSTLGKFKSSGVSLPDTYTKAQMDSFFAGHAGGKYQLDYSNIVNPATLQSFAQTTPIPLVTGTILFSTLPWAFPDFWTVYLKCIANTVAHTWTIGDRVDFAVVTSEISGDNSIRHVPFLNDDGSKVGLSWTNQSSFFLTKKVGGPLFAITNANLAANFIFEAVAKKFTT